MKKQNQLLFARNIFVFLVFVALGVIVVTEKSGGILIPKVKERIDDYIDNNYLSIKKDLLFSDITYKNTKYTMKATSKDNKNHYFIITYNNKKITDTYKDDYLKGKNLLKKIKNNIEKEIINTTNTQSTVIIPHTLDEYTKKVQERIIKEDNLLQLKFFIIKKELTINSWNSKDITKSIESFLSKYKDNNITPKSYTIIITNKEDITKSIEIKNIDEDFITNVEKEIIINDILEDNNTKLLKDNKIKYKYLN